jgi:methionyl-tRNA formyltransferase
MSGKDLRIVFMGTPAFAVASLKQMVEAGYNVVGGVTAPDKPAGRGQVLTASAVKQYAQSAGLNILQPEKLKDPQFIETLQLLKPDLQVVVAFRMLPEMVWALPSKGTFNLHASLLPKYRGAAPINWAIINGEKETGLSTFLLSHEIDTGNILFQETMEIGPEDNVESLHDRMMEKGASLVVKTIEAIASDNVQPIAQEELIAKGYAPTPAPKIFKDDCLIDWHQKGEKIKNRVRGLSPYPSAWTYLYPNEGEPLSAKIFKVVYERAEAEPGELITDGKKILKIGCNDGWITVLELQLAGKKRMKTDEFLRGFPQIAGFKACP